MDLYSESTSKSIVDIQKLTRGFLTRKHLKSEDSQANLSVHMPSRSDVSVFYDPETIEEAIDIPFIVSPIILNAEEVADDYFESREEVSVDHVQTMEPESVFKNGDLVKDRVKSSSSYKSNEETIPFFNEEAGTDEQKKQQQQNLTTFDLGNSLFNLGKKNAKKSLSVSSVSIGVKFIRKLKIQGKSTLNHSVTDEKLNKPFKDSNKKMPEKRNLKVNLEPIERPPHNAPVQSNTPIHLRQSFFKSSGNPLFSEANKEKFAPYYPNYHCREMQMFHLSSKKKLKPLRRKPQQL